MVGPPKRPPPPDLPPGWVAKWDDQYQRYYYVNLKTKKSQWELPVPELGQPPNYEDSTLSSRQGRQQSRLGGQQTQPQQQTVERERVVEHHHYIQQQQPARSGPGMGTGLATGLLLGSVMRRPRTYVLRNSMTFATELGWINRENQPLQKYSRFPHTAMITSY